MIDLAQNLDFGHTLREVHWESDDEFDLAGLVDALSDHQEPVPLFEVSFRRKSIFLVFAYLRDYQP